MHTGPGDTFDFKGEDSTVYNLLSHANISVNAFFQHADYKTPGIRSKLVHGSYMRVVYITIQTNASRTLRAEYNAAKAFVTM